MLHLKVYFYKKLKLLIVNQENLFIYLNLIYDAGLVYITERKMVKNCSGGFILITSLNAAV